MVPKANLQWSQSSVNHRPWWAWLRVVKISELKCILRHLKPLQISGKWIQEEFLMRCLHGFMLATLQEVCVLMFYFHLKSTLASHKEVSVIYIPLITKFVFGSFHVWITLYFFFFFIHRCEWMSNKQRWLWASLSQYVWRICLWMPVWVHCRFQLQKLYR